MQTQVVHQQKATIPMWAPILVVCLLAIASVLAIQMAARDQGTIVTPPAISTVDRGAGERPIWDHEGLGIVGANVGPAVLRAVGGPHSRTKFGSTEPSGGSDPAPEVTTARIEQAR